MSKLALVIFFISVSAVFAPPPNNRDDACVEVNRQSNNEDIRRQLRGLVERLFANSDRTQPELGVQRLEPIVIPRTDPTEIKLTLRGDRTEVHLRNLTLSGYSESVIEQLEVVGSGETRKVILVFRIPKTVVQNAQLRGLSDNSIRASITGVIRDITNYDETLISPSGTRLLRDEIRIEGKSELEIRSRQQIAETAVIELIRSAIDERGREVAPAFFDAIVRERC